MAAVGRISSQLVFGVLIICLGIIFLLDNMGIVYSWDFLQYWPILLIVLGIMKLVQPGRSGRGWGIVLIVLGSVFMLRTLELYYFRFRDLWPLLLILVGAATLWGAYVGRKNPLEGLSDESAMRARAILGGFKRTLTSKSFRGGEITAIMGGCELDLRQAEIEGEQAVINVFALMGGAEITVPEGWVVNLNGTPFLGGFVDETRGTATPGAKRLVLQGTVIMGGVEVKN